MNRNLALPLLLLGTALATPALAAPGATFKCWTNREGIRECGNAVPPEYSQGETTVINKQGVVVDVKPRAKTEEELQAEQAKKREEEARRQAAEKQAAHDRMLLSLFSSEQDIVNSRDQKLQAISATIAVTQAAVEKLEQRAQGYRNRAASLERAGKPIPATLKQDLSMTERDIGDKNHYIATKHAEEQAIRDSYATDIKRFRELKGE